MRILSLPRWKNKTDVCRGVFQEEIDTNDRYSVSVYSLSAGAEWSIEKNLFQTFYIMEGFVSVVMADAKNASLGSKKMNKGKGWLLLPTQSQVIKAEIDSTIFAITNTLPLVGTEIINRAKKVPFNDDRINELSDYVVNKPWGSEQWLVDTDVYVLKGIQMNSGHECSLHLHEQKIEVNLILSGKVRLTLGHSITVDEAIALHYKNGGKQVNFSMATQDVDTVKNIIKPTVIAPGEGWKAHPYEMHQVLSLDTYFALEVSTSEVDDIIRLKDLYNRPSGRIASEHKQ